MWIASAVRPGSVPVYVRGAPSSTNSLSLLMIIPDTCFVRVSYEVKAYLSAMMFGLRKSLRWLLVPRPLQENRSRHAHLGAESVSPCCSHLLMRLRPTPSVRSCFSSLIWGGSTWMSLFVNQSSFKPLSCQTLKKTSGGNGDDANGEGYDKEVGCIAILESLVALKNGSTLLSGSARTG